MSKFIEKLKKKNAEAVKKEKDRLAKVYEEASDSYLDSGYDRYFSKMNRAEAEIKELDDFSKLLDGTSCVPQATSKEDEYLEMLKRIKQKWFYLKFDCPVTAEANGIDEILMDIHI